MASILATKVWRPWVAALGDIDWHELTPLALSLYLPTGYRA